MACVIIANSAAVAGLGGGKLTAFPPTPPNAAAVPGVKRLAAAAAFIALDGPVNSAGLSGPVRRLSLGHPNGVRPEPRIPPGVSMSESGGSLVPPGVPAPGTRARGEVERARRCEEEGSTVGKAKPSSKGLVSCESWPEAPEGKAPPRERGSELARRWRERESGVAAEGVRGWMYHARGMRWTRV